MSFAHTSHSVSPARLKIAPCQNEHFCCIFHQTLIVLSKMICPNFLVQFALLASNATEQQLEFQCSSFSAFFSHDFTFSHKFSFCLVYTGRTCSLQPDEALMVQKGEIPYSYCRYFSLVQYTAVQHPAANAEAILHSHQTANSRHTIALKQIRQRSTDKHSCTI